MRTNLKRATLYTSAGLGAAALAIGFALPANAADTQDIENSTTQSSSQTDTMTGDISAWFDDIASETLSLDGNGVSLSQGPLVSDVANVSDVAGGPILSGNESAIGSGNDVSAPIGSGNDVSVDAPVGSGNDVASGTEVGNGNTTDLGGVGNGNSVGDVGAEVGDITSAVTGSVGDVTSDIGAEVDDLVGDIGGDVDDLVDGILGD